VTDYDLFIGIDYSGAETANASLRSLQVYAGSPGGMPDPSRRWASLDSTASTAYCHTVGGVKRPEGYWFMRGSSVVDGVQAQLRLGSLKSHQDLRRTYILS
jgi:hypothetical protein